MKFRVMTLIAALAPGLQGCGRSESNHNASDTDNKADTISDAYYDLTARCSTQLRSSFQPGFSDHCLNIKGLKRELRVYQPKTGRKPRAVVIALHGGGGSGLESSDAAESALGVFPLLAEKDDFLVIYPSGTNDSTGKLGWNDCRADDTLKSGADDVGFLSEIISQTSQNLGLKPSQIFVTGTSNGAMMTYRLAVEKAHLIGAIATSSANIAKNPTNERCKNGPARPIPVLMTHGTEDPIVPYNGGCVAKLFGSSCERGFVLSAAETINFWLQVNSQVNTTPSLKEIDINRFDSGSAVERKYTELKNTTITWTLNGAGHPPPSKFLNRGNVIVGKQNRDIEFAQVAWEFFKSQIAP